MYDYVTAMMQDTHTHTHKYTYTPPHATRTRAKFSDPSREYRYERYLCVFLPSSSGCESYLALRDSISPTTWKQRNEFPIDSAYLPLDLRELNSKYKVNRSAWNVTRLMTLCIRWNCCCLFVARQIVTLV